MLQPKYFSESIALKSKLKFCHTVPLPRGGFVGLIPSKKKLLAPKRLSGDSSVATPSFSLAISLVTMLDFNTIHDFTFLISFINPAHGCTLPKPNYIVLWLKITPTY